MNVDSWTEEHWWGNAIRVRVQGVVRVDCLEHGPLRKGGARCFSKGRKRQLVTPIRDTRILTIV
jgi:hypothetical protein